MSDPTSPGPGYDTLSAESRAETKVQRSRFLASVHPARDEAEAKTAIAHVAKLHHDCRHVCFAWRLGHGATLHEHRSDAGEPSGSAGDPILNALRQAEVSDVVAVVARYFGGVKLGTGGLGRAYREAAAEALAAAPRRRVLLGEELVLSFPYALQKTVNHLLEGHRGRLVDERYDEGITWRVWLPADRWQAFRDTVEDAGRGLLKTRTPE